MCVFFRPELMFGYNFKIICVTSTFKTELIFKTTVVQLSWIAYYVYNRK